MKSGMENPSLGPLMLGLLIQAILNIQKRCHIYLSKRNQYFVLEHIMVQQSEKNSL